jgi:MFS family permease
MTVPPQGPDPQDYLPWGATPPAPLGLSNAYQAVGEVAAPLLAGFSVTLIGVVAQAPDSLRWPGAVLIALTLAAGLLLTCVQFAFFARRSYWTRDDLLQWYAEEPREPLLQEFKKMHKRHIGEWAAWRERARFTYNAGLAVLALAIALTLVPPERYGHSRVSSSEAGLRWVAAGLAMAFGVAEIVWWWRGREKKEKDDG